MDNTIKKHDRTVSLDIARGITIVLVVIGHYIPDNSPQWYVIFHRFIYSFHMPLFLFISGFIYMQTLKNEPYFSFIKRKVRRLMIPYLVTSSLIITIKLLASSNSSLENPVSIFSYIEMFYLPAAGYFLWFIWVLFTIFLIIPLFSTIRAKCILFFVSVAFYFMPIDFPHYFCFAEFKYNFLYFMFGVLLFYFPQLKRYSEKIPIYIYCLLLAGLFALMELNFYINTISIPTALIGLATICKLSIWITKHLKRERAILLNISSSSFIIYLFHTTFEGFGKAIIPKILVFSNFDVSFILSAILIIAIGVIGPYFIYNIIQYNRILCILFGLNFVKRIS